MTLIKRGTFLFHGTIYSFDGKQIRGISWFSLEREQAINHICYRHYKNPNGRILTYVVKHDINLIDLSKQGELRIFANANGNHALANLLLNSSEYSRYEGYINFPEQAEVMIINVGCLDFVADVHVTLNRLVKYVQVENNNWRMVTKTDDIDDISDITVLNDSGPSDQQHILTNSNNTQMEVIVKKRRDRCIIS